MGFDCLVPVHCINRTYIVCTCRFDVVSHGDCSMIMT